MRLSIRQFQEVYKVVTSTDDEIDRLTGVCAILHGGNAKDYLSKTPSELAKYRVDISIPEGKAPVVFYCQGKKYFVNHLISTIKAGEFVDLTEFTKSESALVQNIHNIMAIFCTHQPKWFGKKQTRDQVAKWLQDHCDIRVAYPTAVFFCNLYKALQRSILDYSMKDQLKTLKEQRKAVQEVLDSLNESTGG